MMAAIEYPAKLFVEVTTRCNLQCGMCVKQNGTGGIPEGSMSADTFERLAPAASEEEFEQDCYLEPVPCGACLWCTGLFHCLQ